MAQQYNYFKRIGIWMGERFPPIGFSTAAFMYFLPKCMMLERHNLAWRWEWLDIVGFFYVASLLLLLRVLDEHKDFSSDQMNYKDRVLQRGIVSLNDLKILGVVLGAIQLGAFVIMRPRGQELLAGVLVWWWIFLMFKEFFAREWLRARLVLYSLLHLLVSPLISAFIALKFSGGAVDGEGIAILMVIALLTGLIFEVSRKTKGPEEETSEMTFSKLWGRPKSLIIIFLIFLACIFPTVEIFREFHILNFWLYIGLTATGVLYLLQLKSFQQQPTAKNRKKNEGMAALVGTIAYVVPVVTVWIQSW